MVSLKSWVFHPENGTAYKSSTGGTRWRCARCPDEATAKTFILKSCHIFEHLKTHDVYKPKSDGEDDEGEEDGDGDDEGDKDGSEGSQEGEQEKNATVGTLRRSKRGKGAAGGGI